MSDTKNDIDALLRYLKSGHTPHWYDDSTRWHAALTALVAERDALRDQRDEARREVCKLNAEIYGHFGDNDRLVVHRASYMPTDVAKERGWDCFARKEGGGA